MRPKILKKNKQKSSKAKSKKANSTRNKKKKQKKKISKQAEPTKIEKLLEEKLTRKEESEKENGKEKEKFRFDDILRDQQHSKGFEKFQENKKVIEYLFEEKSKESTDPELFQFLVLTNKFFNLHLNN